MLLYASTVLLWSVIVMLLLKNVMLGFINKKPCKLFKKFKPKMNGYNLTGETNVNGKLNCCFSTLIDSLLIQFVK